MTEDVARVLALLERLLELAPADREPLLARECAGDETLLGHVRAMLEADGRRDAVLDQPLDLLASEPSPVEVEWRGREVGPYRLIRELGRGGMGVVFLAERGDVRARVAIKLLVGRHASPELRARFEEERRILAHLEHPNIARFLDAGLTDDGTPWFAMEYVDGRPISAHCDAERLSVAERLELMEHVAEAVAYAHRNLLVHRDLKPSNILVSGAGVPKLLDFGIAKLVSTDVPNAITRASVVPPMTPDYASPEQVRGDPITTASDVYQLGILLHEILTGRRPTTPSGETLRPFDRARCVRFAKLSTLATSEVRPAQLASGPPDQTAEEVSALRGVTPPQLGRHLAGDLDAIVDTALRCEPAQRYGTAQELLADLRSLRTGMPVQARRPSVPYLALRFLRRHTVSVGLAAALAIAVTAAAAVFFLQARHVSRERDRAEQVSGVLERLVSIGNPSPGPGDTAAAAMLREVAARGRANLFRDPEVWGRILVIVGGVYDEAGQPDTAVAVWREVIAALQPRVPPDDSVLLDAEGRLGVTLVKQGEFDTGLGVLESALGRARTLSPERRADLGSALYDAAFGRQVAGDDRTAHRLYLEALTHLGALPDSGGIDYDRILLNLGYLADRQGDPAAAEGLFRAALERRRRRDGEAHDRTLNAVTSLARVLIQGGNLEEADSLSRFALEERRRQSRSPDPDLAEALNVRATVLVARREPAEAERLGLEATAMFREVFGNEHFVVGHAEAVVASAVAGQGRVAEAARIQRNAVSRYRTTAGDRHPGTVRAIVRLAQYEVTLGRMTTAERLYREALPALDSIVGGRPAVAPVEAGFGILLAETGRCEEATPHLRRALALAPSASGDGAWAPRARDRLWACEGSG